MFESVELSSLLHGGGEGNKYKMATAHGEKTKIGEDTLAGRLKKARVMRGLSQSKLATLVGIRAQAVQALESGENHSTTKIVEMAKALDVRAEWLALGELPIERQHRFEGASVNEETLETVLAAIESFLAERGLRLSAEKKAVLATTVYSMALKMTDEKEIDRAVSSLFRLVA